MKILIPTDFSKLSEVAVHYAVKLAKKMNAEISLLHVVHFTAPPRAMVAVTTNSFDDAMVKNANQDIMQLIKELKEEYKGKLHINHEIIIGYPVEDVIDSYAIQNDIDLIIMGTKGAAGLTKILIGSNATAVINNSKIPVITIPEFARFDDIKHMVYATDFLNLNEELEVVLPLAKLFDATLHILHIVASESKVKKDTKIMVDKVQFKYPKIILHVSNSDDILKGIDEFLGDIKADMLVMFTHEVTLYEQIFGKSITRQMAFHNSMPLLTLKKLE
jgi:nucleotide-binding universal stress UspA family protein